MKNDEFQEKLQSIPDSELAKKADSILDKLCKTGARSFVMSVPPSIDDTDMVFAELIRRFQERIKSNTK